MVSLTLMARLVEAVRPDARLVLVGDPGQLTSIEAGAVLGDIVGPAATGLRMRAPARRALERATGRPVQAAEVAPATSAGDGIVVLDRSHRFGAGIAALADAVRRGDGDATIAALRAGASDVDWIEADLGDGAAPDALAPLRAGATAAARAVTRAAAARRRAPPRSRRSARSGCCARTVAGRTGRAPGARASRAGCRPRSTASRRRARGTSGDRCS